MTALVDPFDDVAVPRDLLAEFFGVFARCKYATKEAGYKRNDHGIAAPAWLRLANDASTWLDVLRGSDVKQAIALLTSAPPKLLSLMDGWLSSPVHGASAIAQVIEAAARGGTTFSMAVSTLLRRRSAATRGWCVLS